MRKITSLFAVLFALSTSCATAQEIQSFEVKSRFIKTFKIGSDQKQFGPLEFVGGLEMIGQSEDFGAISGIDIAQDQSSFIAVADTGFWIEGTIERNENLLPTGLANVSMSEITNAAGLPISEKWQADAEGIILINDEITISLERAHRIAKYKKQDGITPVLKHEFAPPVPIYELRQNRGFEAIAIAPLNTPWVGALVGISEKSLDDNKNIMSFVKPLNTEAFEFSLKRTDEFDVTDMAFLPDGDLIILERRFNVSDGIGMRLRHIKTQNIKKGVTVDGSVILTADFLHQIDNMEGLSITTDSDGTPRLTLVSDDNHSLLQRNLLLEFKLNKKLN